MHISISTGIFPLLFLTSNAQYLPGLYETQVPQLSTFFTLLNRTSDLYNRIAQGGVTVLAPTNDAFNALWPNGPNNSSKEQIDALLSYHVLQGVHSSVSLDNSPSFLPTLLQDEAYTNITGGQVVESVPGTGRAFFTSAVWAKSRIVTPDIFYISGLIHSIDAVLTMPQMYGSTVTAANLNDYVGLLETTKFVKPGHIPLLLAIDILPDMTLFCPNSPQYSSDYTGLEHLTYQQQLEILGYHQVNGSLLYSTNLTNGSSFTTTMGANLTAWLGGDGSLYINDAKVTQTDLLYANGVVQVIDKLLDPNDTNAHPNFSSSAASKNESDYWNGASGLNAAELAGIGVGCSVAGLAILFAIAYQVLRRRRRHKNTSNPCQARDGDGNASVDGTPPVPVASKPSMQAHEMETRAPEMETKWNTWELAKPEGVKLAHVDRHELPGTSWTLI